jgi:hypothetical protein
MNTVSAIPASYGLVAAGPILARGAATQIAKDLRGVRPDRIKPRDNPAELTHIVLVIVPELLPDGGTAELSYVFGDKSKTLSPVLLNCPARHANIRNSSENQRPLIRTPSVLATTGQGAAGGEHNNGRAGTEAPDRVASVLDGTGRGDGVSIGA